ncbi:hypothetical protein [Cellulomonas sp. Leaf334]|uniref:hypothetical protein n=1 Tax=Cellulomonas sp. Leaf334 TaxID=1736339 RepID=UPI001F43DE6C|nr:hypothetical protein [Cellulomonas sp. Leaf334]
MDGSLGRGRVAAAIAADVATPALLSQTVAVSTATIIGDGGSCSSPEAETVVSRSCGDVAVAVLVSEGSGRIGAAVLAADVEVRVGVTVGGITLAGTVKAVDPLDPFRLGTCVAGSSVSVHVGPVPVRGADVV